MKSKTTNCYQSKSKHRKQCVDAVTSISKPSILSNGVFIGIASLFWLILKTGRKPSRIAYPCQQTALANIGIFLVPPVALMAYQCRTWLRRIATPKLLFGVMLSGVLLGAVSGGWWGYKQYQIQSYYQQLRLNGPFGKPIMAAAGAAAVTYLSIPHAMALPSPHRVVSVHDTDATSWTFSCTSSGTCAEYYGDDAYVDQDVVDQMVVSGMKALTGEDTVDDAWDAILPAYQPGEVVAIKVNFNDSIMGGGTSGYGDNDAYVDALPQIINSIIDGLTSIGVSEDDIWIFDVSRYITDRFRARIDYASVRYFDRYGNGADVAAAAFDSTDLSAAVVFTDTAYSGSHSVSDVLVDADYLINVPIMKRHGGAGITLALKNHLGSINGFYSGGHTMHNYIYLGNGSYDSDSNPMVDISLNANIMDKTVLVIGDALYGGWSSNNTPPERWDSFGDDSPNMLFFGADPVAVDSVMFDYLDREGYVNPKSEDIFIIAANEGIGVHERWNNDTDRVYQTIDYVEIEGADPDPDPDPGPDPDTQNSSNSSSGGCFIRTIGHDFRFSG